MNAIRCVAWALAIGVGGTIPRAGAQGDLEPAAPPGPTMLTLAQVEPRIPITNLPYVIEQPGSYYLASNLTSTWHGVMIRTNAVVLDLMGFAISGDGDSADSGIYLGGLDNLSVRGVVVRNGSVRNFGNGIRADSSHDGRFERLSISDNVGDGVWFYSADRSNIGNVISECSIASNVLNGIGWYADQGLCVGNSVVDCTIIGNGDQGIQLRVSRSGDGITRCDGNVIARCTISGNTFDGVMLEATSTGRCGGNRVVDCAISGNGGAGVSLKGSTSGICRDNTIEGCAVSGNGQRGLELVGASGGVCDGNTVAGCVVRRNVGSGIHLELAQGNRIEGNHVSTPGGSYGISCQAMTTTNNLLLRNSSMGHVQNYAPGADDTYGPGVTAVGELATSGAEAHPWANFSR